MLCSACAACARPSAGWSAVRDLSFDIRPRRHHRPDRPQRLGQDHRAQPDHRRIAPRPRRHPLRGRGHLRAGRRSASAASRIARTFQLVRVLPYMTAQENVMLGRMFGSEPGDALRQPRARPKRCSSASVSAGAATSSAPSSPTSTRSASSLPARSPCRPQLLLLDEWLAGLNPDRAAGRHRADPADPRRRHHHRHDRARHGGHPRPVRPGRGHECRRAIAEGTPRRGAVGPRR